jgi:hypothetical protein
MADAKISTTLRKAAELLGDGTQGSGFTFICHAISAVKNIGWQEATWGYVYRKWPEVVFLCSLGMEVSGGAFMNWNEAAAASDEDNILSDRQCQEVRYAWLQLAADIAEEQGL